MKSLILFVSVFSLFSFAADDQVTWTKVSLSQEDTRGSNALLALVRKIDGFAKLLKGEELGPSTQIMVRKPKVQAKSKSSLAVEEVFDEATGKKIKARVLTIKQVSSLRYIVTERDAKDAELYKRVLLIKEEILTTTKTRKADPKDKDSRDILVSSSVEYNYPALDVSDSNLDSKSSEAYKAAAAKLYAEGAPECVEFAGGAELCRISPAATKLIRAASRKADELAATVAKAKEEKKLVLDTTSRKSVSFEESSTGAIRNVVLSGFVRSPAEKLEAPDAVSAWVVIIDGEGKATFEERKAADEDKVIFKDE